jgi:transcriptional regulator with XRE-family HTH domain
MTLNAAHASDLARRVAHRRHELELTLEEVARRAGMTRSISTTSSMPRPSTSRAAR